MVTILTPPRALLPCDRRCKQPSWQWPQLSARCPRTSGWNGSAKCKQGIKSTVSAHNRGFQLFGELCFVAYLDACFKIMRSICAKTKQKKPFGAFFGSAKSILCFGAFVLFPKQNHRGPKTKAPKRPRNAGAVRRSQPGEDGSPAACRCR